MTADAQPEGALKTELPVEAVDALDEKPQEPMPPVSEEKNIVPPEQETKEAAMPEMEKTTKETTMVKSSSYKEESNFLSDLKDHERKALLDLRSKLEESILANDIVDKVPAEAANAEGEGDKAMPEKAMEASLWGVPLLPSKGSETTDVILLKFLRARDFKVKEASEMLNRTLQWRKEFKADSILDDKSLGAGLAAACYMDGTDREGHPVCYNISGVFEEDEFYQKVLGTEEARERFLRWRVQLMEQGIKKLDLRPGGAASLLQITDLKNAPGPSKKELRATMKQAVDILQDNYPEFVARNIFINVPFWYYAFHAVLSPFLTQRTKSKMVFVRPAKVTETLLKYIPIEAIPSRYGGLKRDNDTEFSDGEVSELTVKASSTETVEIDAPEEGTTLVWDLIVLGWEVNYKEEFVPTDEGSYTIIVQKSKKMGLQEEAVRNSFRNSEPGKVILTIENSAYKKKRVFFRYKTKRC